VSGPVFSLYFEKFADASLDDVRELLVSLTTARQRAARDTWMPERRRGWELFIDASIIPPVLRKRKERSKRDATGMMLLNYGEGLAVSEAEASALRGTIGFVPGHSWSGAAMAKDPIDVDGLYFLIDQLVGRFGGWQRIAEKPGLPGGICPNHPGVHEIDYTDLDAYFGKQPIDEVYRRQYEQYAPRGKYWMVEVAKAGFRTLDD
jgi:hypothetical protein